MLLGGRARRRAGARRGGDHDRGRPRDGRLGADLGVGPARARRRRPRHGCSTEVDVVLGSGPGGRRAWMVRLRPTCPGPARCSTRRCASTRPRGWSPAEPSPTTSLPGSRSPRGRWSSSAPMPCTGTPGRGPTPSGSTRRGSTPSARADLQRERVRALRVRAAAVHRSRLRAARGDAAAGQDQPAVRAPPALPPPRRGRRARHHPAQARAGHAPGATAVVIDASGSAPSSCCTATRATAPPTGRPGSPRSCRDLGVTVRYPALPDPFAPDLVAWSRGARAWSSRATRPRAGGRGALPRLPPLGPRRGSPRSRRSPIGPCSWPRPAVAETRATFPRLPPGPLDAATLVRAAARTDVVLGGGDPWRASRDDFHGEGSTCARSRAAATSTSTRATGRGRSCSTGCLTEGRRPAWQADPDVQPAARPLPSDSHVPLTLRVAAAWAWRVLVLAFAVAALVAAVSRLQFVALAIFVALLLTAFLTPFHARLLTWGAPRWLATAATLVSFILVLVGLVALIGGSIANEWGTLSVAFQDGSGRHPSLAVRRSPARVGQPDRRLDRQPAEDVVEQPGVAGLGGAVDRGDGRRGGLRGVPRAVLDDLLPARRQGDRRAGSSRCSRSARRKASARPGPRPG